MIKSFVDAEVQAFFEKRKVPNRWPKEILKRAMMRLQQLDFIKHIEDLQNPPSNRLEKLSRDRKGQWSIRINKQWRICFVFEDGNAYDVEIVDYH